ncbi:hypothetical protein Pmani_036182 [Petrolisthes manimaculis]|uniref:Uncharacterized protein n=1 Tax=Petrolisthes manimaculis TaxID=1843537 RepID=A0AAE1NKQ1_9EUCA|nr:hypothetical protein Pmani_036182 [Petrolisthes manimaculis]
MDASIKQGVPVPLVLPSDVGTSSIMGKRPYQEDRYVVETLSNNILCVGVFDGHGGNECSQYCYTHLKSVLSEELTRHHDLQTVLHNTFHTLHTRYTHWVHTYKQGYRSGTTACVSLLRGGVELALAHVGDSRAILCRSGGQPVNLTADHCPSLIAEKNRIVSSGGTVTTDNIGRHLVNDTLSMSRSLGDLHLKPYGVIPLPDTRTLRVKHGKDAFLLHITDGINFVLTSEEACDIINQTEDPHQAAIVLTEQAQSMASEDNITAVVVPFGSWGKYTKSASMFYSFGIGRDMNKSSSISSQAENIFYYFVLLYMRMDCKVYVGNLGNNAAKHELESAFTKYGPLVNVWVARNPPGFAFVEFEDPRDAEDAVRALDGTRLCGVRVRVEMSTGRSRRDRYRSPPRRGGSRRSRSRSPRRFGRSRSRSPRRSRSRSPRYDDYRRRSDSPDFRRRSRSRST